MAHRNRVIYQSEALFVSPLSTGYHATGAPTSFQTKGGQPYAMVAPGADPSFSLESFDTQQRQSIVSQLKRVQSANYSFTINRQDVNQFGQLARIDSLVVDTPSVALDFNYLITDGENERLLNFVTDGVTNTLSGLIDPEVSNAGQNFFILTVPEGADAYLGDQNSSGSNTVVALGNGYLSDYSMDASVGSFPTASCSIEGFNIQSSATGEACLDIPAINPGNGSRDCKRTYTIPATTTGSGIAALRPGDITLNLANAGLLSKQAVYDGDSSTPSVGSAHVQSVSISVPLSRTVLQRLGSTFGFSREIDFPVSATLTVNALVSELEQGNMLDLICGLQQADLSVTLRNPECIECNRGSSDLGISYILKGATLESESYSSAIGDNKSVDLTWSAQLGGPEDTLKGLFISGSSARYSPVLQKVNGQVHLGQVRPVSF